MTFIAGTSTRIDVAPHPRLCAAIMDWERCARVADLADARTLVVSDDVRPWCGIADVGPGAATFRYSFFGAQLCAAFGRDMTGRSPSELDPPGYAEIIVQQYVEATAARRPLIHAVWSAALPNDLYYRVTIPFSNGGAEVAQLWMVTAHLKRFAAGLPTRARDLDAVLFA